MAKMSNVCPMISHCLPQTKGSRLRAPWSLSRSIKPEQWCLATECSRVLLINTSEGRGISGKMLGLEKQPRHLSYMASRTACVSGWTHPSSRQALIPLLSHMYEKHTDMCRRELPVTQVRNKEAAAYQVPCLSDL